jgi:hypothetical protein
MVSTMAARSLTQLASCAIALHATATMESTSSSKVFMIERSRIGQMPAYGHHETARRLRSPDFETIASVARFCGGTVS